MGHFFRQLNLLKHWGSLGLKCITCFCWWFPRSSHHYPTPPGCLTVYINFMIYFLKQKASPTLDCVPMQTFELWGKEFIVFFCQDLGGKGSWETRHCRENETVWFFVRDLNESQNRAERLHSEIFREIESPWPHKEITVSCSLEISFLKLKVF